MGDGSAGSVLGGSHHPGGGIGAVGFVPEPLRDRPQPHPATGCVDAMQARAAPDQVTTDLREKRRCDGLLHPVVADGFCVCEGSGECPGCGLDGGGGSGVGGPCGCLSFELGDDRVEEVAAPVGCPGFGLCALEPAHHGPQRR